MALLTSILTRIKKIFLLLFAILKKGLCCRKRCRTNSGMILPLTVSVDKKDDNLVANKEIISSPLTNGYQDINNAQNITFTNDWNDWNNQQNSQLMSKPIPNQNLNESNIRSNYYTNESVVSRNVCLNSNTNTNSNNKVEVNSTEEQESEHDFFKDMVPDFRRPKKILLATNQSNDAIKSNRFGVDTKATIVQSRELGVIDHFDDGGSWEDNAASEEMWDADATLRDIRQAEREKRIAEHQRIKLEKEMKKAKASKANFVATKIS